MTNKIIDIIDRASIAWFAFAAAVIIVIGAGLFWWSGTLVTTYSVPPQTVTSFKDCLYFSVVTFTSLGYGDLRPIGNGRGFASSEVLLGLAFLGLLITKLSSSRQSYFMGRLFASDVQQRLDKFSEGFYSLRLRLESLLESSDAKEHTANVSADVEKANVYCVSLLSFLRFETSHGSFFPDISTRVVRRVIRYLFLYLAALAKVHTAFGRTEYSQKNLRDLLRNTELLGQLVRNKAKNPLLTKDCKRLETEVSSLRVMSNLKGQSQHA